MRPVWGALAEDIGGYRPWEFCEVLLTPPTIERGRLRKVITGTLYTGYPQKHPQPSGAREAASDRIRRPVAVSFWLEEFYLFSTALKGVVDFSGKRL